MKKTVIAAAVATTLGVASISAQAATVGIGSMSITGGSFAMGVFTPAPNPINNASGADIIAGYQAPGWDVNTAQGGPDASAVMAFDFNGGGTWVNVYSAATAVQGGVAGGGPVPNGTMDDAGGAITVDLTSFFANWNGTDFNQGGSATGTTSNCSAGTCDFTVNWSSLIVGGPFNGQTGTWQATGTVTAVPVPAAVWLMGSGLMGLVGVARRRRKS